MDFVAPLVPPGLGFGRLGNYIGGELWGKPTDAGWGVVFPTRCREFAAAGRRSSSQAQFATGALDAYARHPSQLYQAVPRRAGDVRGAVVVLAQAAAALCGVGPVRAAVRRVPLRWSSSCACPTQQLGYLAFGWLTMGQVLSLPLIALGLFLLWLSRRAPTLQPAPLPATAG